MPTKQEIGTLMFISGLAFLIAKDFSFGWNFFPHTLAEAYCDMLGCSVGFIGVLLRHFPQK